MTQIEKALSRYGLSDNEVKAYLEIIKHEETSPYEISRQTGIARTTVYDVITGLALKGLIEVQESSGFQKQQTKIKAKNPSVLRELLAKKRNELTELEVDIVDILPQLKGSFLQEQSNPNFQFYPGVEGLKYVLGKSYLLDVKTEICAWDCMMPMDFIGREEMNQLVDQELKIRGAKNIRPKTLIALTPWTKHVVGYQYSRDPNYTVYHDLRYVENPSFDLHQDIYIYSDTVTIACAKENEVWGMVIKSELYACTMRNIFNLIWAVAKPVTTDYVQSLLPNEFFEAEKKNKRVK